MCNAYITHIRTYTNCITSLLLSEWLQNRGFHHTDIMRCTSLLSCSTGPRAFPSWNLPSLRWYRTSQRAPHAGSSSTVSKTTTAPTSRTSPWTWRRHRTSSCVRSLARATAWTSWGSSSFLPPWVRGATHTHTYSNSPSLTESVTHSLLTQPLQCDCVVCTKWISLISSGIYLSRHHAG